MKEKINENAVAQQIMDAAIPLFAVKGYTGVSIRELSKEARVNSALISYYFGGKSELYSSILKTQLELLVAAVSVVEKEKLSPIEEIYLFSEKLCSLHKKYPYLIRIVLGEIVNPTFCYDSVVKVGIENINHALKDCIQRGMNSGEIRNDIDPAATAVSLVGMINFYFLTFPLSQELFMEKGKAINHYIKESIEQYLHGILMH
ncbi:TetR family transcriptional regulator [Clostridium sp. BL-8]|uniref:TetR/AcrR family transcriptional regulator n=1 Tax=Clostridium sp. BL-8 TaxID=349938 RepID=UPI00098C9640|nr:TetR family transcriptional regulator [Clostridium sp. BL-8]OOM80122.1 HTH-type transcriptional repressor [Clostridium sp. BL-8]